ncbi:MAG: sporulation protein YabP [Bacilli bacterium]|jgi:sporulation protein YabP|nr:sporulation protein YabP [Bacilli bacterium]
MDKEQTLMTSLNHNITISDRKNIVITGVKKIESFDDEEFLMDTSMGYVIIKGEALEVIKLDTYQGNVSIKGKINQLSYMENSSKKDKEDGLFNKLFK